MNASEKQPESTIPVVSVMAAALLLVLVATHWATLGVMVERWTHDPQYSHGFVVPLSPDLFSLTALPSVGASTARWIMDWQAALGNERHIAVFVIFNLAATAESDAHGELLQRIRYRVDGRIPVVPLVDTSNYVERDPDRFRERCNQWRTVLDAIGLKPLFINLASADDEAVLQDLGARLNAHG